MFDIILFVTILIFMWKGYDRKFEREMPRLLSLIGAILCGLVFYEVIGLLLNLTPLPSIIGSWTTSEFLKEVSGTEVGNGTVNKIFATLPNEDNKEIIVGEFVVKFLSFMLLFIIAYVVFRKVFKKIKLFQKRKVVKQLRPALGGLVGLFRGILYAYIAIAFLVILEPIIPTDAIKNQVDNSEMVRFIYDENYIANIVARRDFLSTDY